MFCVVDFCGCPPHPHWGDMRREIVCTAGRPLLCLTGVNHGETFGERLLEPSAAEPCGWALRDPHAPSKHFFVSEGVKRVYFAFKRALS